MLYVSCSASTQRAPGSILSLSSSTAVRKFNKDEVFPSRGTAGLLGRWAIIEGYYKILYKNNINTYAKNFLVTQDEAVSLVERTPKDLSQFFEHLSGSLVHKNKCDVLKKEIVYRSGNPM